MSPISTPSQHTKTWKESNDPNYEVKKNAVLDLYERCPENGAVICFDECGPLDLRPLAGKGWSRSGHPQRFRATYRRLQGAEQLLSFYDVRADCLVGQVRKHKRGDDLLAVFARLRACYPMDVRLSVVMDNLNTHKHARLKAFMAAHNIEPAYTPTYSSWLNAIEAHFTSLKKFAIGGTDDPRHAFRCRPCRRSRGGPGDSPVAGTFGYCQVTRLPCGLRTLLWRGSGTSAVCPSPERCRTAISSPTIRCSLVGSSSGRVIAQDRNSSTWKPSG